MRAGGKFLGLIALPKKLTAELTISAIIASIIESYLLLRLGLLAATDLKVFLFVAAVLGIADIILILTLEELLIRTRFGISRLRGD